jgi:hypothetical protein
MYDHLPQWLLNHRAGAPVSETIVSDPGRLVPNMQVKGKRFFMFALILVQCAFIVTFVLFMEYDTSAKPSSSVGDSEDIAAPGPGNLQPMYPSKCHIVLLYSVPLCHTVCTLHIECGAKAYISSGRVSLKKCCFGLVKATHSERQWYYGKV